MGILRRYNVYIKYIELIGYIGIYNGLGRKRISIDFSKCKNKICVITGPNGCGKSTLLSAINILPDYNFSLLPSMKCSKRIVLIDENNTYDINILYPIDKNNTRATTKAYIKKNGIELNTNGNISSYKDIIFNEFDLDGNFITLTRISSDDRGLADKKPAERKKFIASISSSLEAYNDIYKNISKKASVYKTYINNLITKIKSIGDESSLRSTIVSLTNRETNLTNTIDRLKTEIIQNQTMIQLNDLDGKLQERFNSISKELDTAKKEDDRAFINLRNYYENNFNIDETKLDKSYLESVQRDLLSKIQSYSDNKNTNCTNILVLTNNIQNYSERIEYNNTKISKLSKEINLELDNQIEKYKKRIEELHTRFKEYGIRDNTISNGSSIINQIIKILSDFISIIDVLYDSNSENNIQYLIQLKQSGKVLSTEIDRCIRLIDSINNELLEIDKQYIELQNDLDIVSELDNRPESCTESKCYFLSKPLKVLSKYGSKESIIDEIEELKDKSINNKKLLDNTRKELEKLKSLSSSDTILDKATILLDTNQEILSSFSVSIRLTDINFLYDKIFNRYTFNEYRDLTELHYLSNELIEYNQIIITYNNLLLEKKTNENNIAEYNELKSDTEKLNILMEEDKEKRKSLLADNEFIDGLLNNLNSKNTNISKLLELYSIWVDIDNKYQLLKHEYDNMQNQFKGSADILDNISKAQTELMTCKSELEPVIEQRKLIDSQILLLDQYKNDYAKYNEKYTILDKLKKYSSPTTGIQSVFMYMYMNKTLEMANQLLSMIFQGQYKLLDYVINQEEFRIPFIGNGLVVDDISSGSTSQVCIMGMIINLVLLNQASTKYNITRLDEIDGGLDHQNRYMFVDILQTVINILNIDQLFIISHSAESALSNVDIIQLAPIPDYEDMFRGANIIYSYKENQ